MWDVKSDRLYAGVHKIPYNIKYKEQTPVQASSLYEFSNNSGLLLENIEAGLL